ncbi:hypothetical protein HK101_006141 [Irineochytrium annulatum]|nr:hypothetical protein HK101_006141 [Irineochytrium annulatum]
MDVRSRRDGWDVVCGFKDGNLRGWRMEVPDGTGEVDATGAMAVEGELVPAEPSRLRVSREGTLSSLSDLICCVHVDPTAEVVVAGSWDGRLRVWDRRKVSDVSGDEFGGRLRRTLFTDSRSAVMSMAVVGEIMASGCYDGSVTVWEWGQD